MGAMTHYGIRTDTLLLECANEVDWLLDTLPGTAALRQRIWDEVNDLLTASSDNLEGDYIETKHLRTLARYTQLQADLARALDDAVIVGRLLHYMVGQDYV